MSRKNWTAARKRTLSLTADLSLNLRWDHTIPGINRSTFFLKMRLIDGFSKLLEKSVISGDFLE